MGISYQAPHRYAPVDSFKPINEGLDFLLQARQAQAAQEHQRAQTLLSQRQSKREDDMETHRVRKEQADAIQDAQKMHLRDPQGAINRLRAAGIDVTGVSDVHDDSRIGTGVSLPSTLANPEERPAMPYDVPAPPTPGDAPTQPTPLADMPVIDTSKPDAMKPSYQAPVVDPDAKMEAAGHGRGAGDEIDSMLAPALAEKQQHGPLIGKAIKYKLAGQDGELTLDPRETRDIERSQREEAARLAKEAFGDNEEGMMAAGLARQGYKPEDIGKLMATRSGQKQASDDRKEAREQRTFENEEFRKARHEDTNTIAEAMKAGRFAGQGNKDDATTLQNVKYANEEYDRLAEKAGLTQNAKEYRQLTGSLTMSFKPNGLSQNAVKFALGRAINGPGVFTDADRKAIIGSIGGLGTQFMSKLTNGLYGEFSPREMAIVRDAVKNQLEVVNGRARDFQENIVPGRFGATSEFANMQGHIANRLKGTMSVFGVKDEGDEKPGAELQVGTNMIDKNKRRAHTVKTGGKGDLADRVLGSLK